MDGLLLSEILGVPLRGKNAEVKGFCINSKKVKEGDVFVALRGKRADGHDFIGEAFERGAVGVISEREVSPPKGRFALVVPSSLGALREIASFKRRRFSGIVIGVAGSAGKTTTKELIYHLLSSVGEAYRSPGNLNSQIGLPLAVANAPLGARFWVLEHGASARGEIRNLISITKPHVRLITKIGEEHLEGFGSLEGVVLGNGEMFCSLGSMERAVIPADTLRYYSFIPKDLRITFGDGGDVRAEDFSVSGDGVRIRFEGREFFVGIPSVGMVENVLASFALLKALGYKPEGFLDVLKGFKPQEGRMQVIKFKNFTLINDAYNANPPSVRNAVMSLKAMGGKRIVILGDMLELGSRSGELHEEVGRLLSGADLSFAFFVGNEMRRAFEVYDGRKVWARDVGELSRLVREYKQELRNGVILIKGSRAVGLEEIIRILGGIDNELSR
ncbi:MAG: UDP-N-acetylmuramoyl-tripeptide--D-alanyl-D-alanine ligase [Aquificae bacterium]|nr:UDP-N-acetylmuramoyl-tripeptide--D-alanyl-D-alanine ligase [Aquificota bacterium]